MTFQNYFWRMSLVFLACAGMRVSREVCACASEPIIYYIERKFIIWNNECLLGGSHHIPVDVSTWLTLSPSSKSFSFVRWLGPGSYNCCFVACWLVGCFGTCLRQPCQVFKPVNSAKERAHVRGIKLIFSFDMILWLKVINEGTFYGS